MLLLLRRFIIFQLFLAWQGGFFFYAAVVVPIGTEILGSRELQGTITQPVSHWLNILGAAWCVAMILEVLATRRTGAFWWRLGLILLASMLLVALVLIHPVLDDLFNPETASVRDRPRFRFWHAVYLWICTIHWIIGLVVAWLTLRSCAQQDCANLLSERGV